MLLVIEGPLILYAVWIVCWGTPPQTRLIVTRPIWSRNCFIWFTQHKILPRFLTQISLFNDPYQVTLKFSSHARSQSIHFYSTSLPLNSLIAKIVPSSSYDFHTHSKYSLWWFYRTEETKRWERQVMTTVKCLRNLLPATVEEEGVRRI